MYHLFYEGGPLDTIDRMKIFERVAAVSSFTKAAEELNLPKSTVSNAIQELEQSMLVRLLQRTTRQVSLTYEGEKYLERCRVLLTDLEETQTMFLKRPEQIRGKVRIDASASMANRTIIPRLPELLEKHPDLEVEISCTDQTIDLVKSGIDCAIRSGSISQIGTVEKLLGEASMGNFVSPRYVQKYGMPQSLEDLKNHRLIFYSQVLGSKKWGFEYYDGKEYREFKMGGDITINNTDAYRSACLSGLGIAQHPHFSVKAYVQSGELIEILKDYQAEPLKIKIVYSQRRLMAARVRTLIDWIEPIIKKQIAEGC